jgi:L-galactose dehydrogenase
MQYRRLGNTDMDVSILSYGASPMGNVFDVEEESAGIRAVHYAIDHGINFFDVAPFYGATLAEQRLGKALKGKRQDIYLATKCGRYGLQDFDFSYKRVLQSIDESLQRLQTDYVDIYQLHDIEFVDKEQILQEAIPAAMKVKEMGKARYIGITGLPVRYLAAIAREVKPDTVLSWAHYNLLENEINDELVPLSREQGFGLMNAGPLLQRILSDAALPAWHRSPQAVKDMQPRLLDLCSSYGVDLSEVAIRYALDHPDIHTTIVGIANMHHVTRNLKAVDLRIPDGLLADIDRLVSPVRNQMWYEGKPENNIPKLHHP